MPEVSTEPIRIVVCEDEEDLRDILQEGLPDFGFTVFGVPSAEALTHFLAQQEADVLLLDIGLPGEDGYSVAKRLRKERPGLGIIMLTAKGQVDDRVRGLVGGADLYFVKPVDLRELAAAISSLHRRVARTIPEPPRTWHLDSVQSTLYAPSGRSSKLTTSEFCLLSVLMASPGSTVERADLLRSLGWLPEATSTHRLTALINRLRTKVHQDCPDEALPLQARHGSGYAFLASSDLQP